MPPHAGYNCRRRVEGYSDSKLFHNHRSAILRQAPRMNARYTLRLPSQRISSRREYPSPPMVRSLFERRS